MNEADVMMSVPTEVMPEVTAPKVMPEVREMTLGEQCVHALRTTTKEQCRGKFYRDGAFCAWGVLVNEVVGFKASDNRSLSDDCSWQRLWEALGRPPMVMWNDCERLSFREIADRLETWVANGGQE